jgi:hypothetical protein
MQISRSIMYIYDECTYSHIYEHRHIFIAYIYITNLKRILQDLTVEEKTKCRLHRMILIDQFRVRVWPMATWAIMMYVH